MSSSSKDKISEKKCLVEEIGDVRHGFSIESNGHSSIGIIPADIKDSKAIKYRSLAQTFFNSFDNFVAVYYFDYNDFDFTLDNFKSPYEFSKLVDGEYWICAIKDGVVYLDETGDFNHIRSIFESFSDISWSQAVGDHAKNLEDYFDGSTNFVSPSLPELAEQGSPKARRLVGVDSFLLMIGLGLILIIVLVLGGFFGYKSLSSSDVVAQIANIETPEARHSRLKSVIDSKVNGLAILDKRNFSADAHLRHWLSIFNHSMGGWRFSEIDCKANGSCTARWNAVIPSDGSYLSDLIGIEASKTRISRDGKIVDTLLDPVESIKSSVDFKPISDKHEILKGADILFNVNRRLVRDMVLLSNAFPDLKWSVLSDEMIEMPSFSSEPEFGYSKSYRLLAHSFEGEGYLAYKDMVSTLKAYDFSIDELKVKIEGGVKFNWYLRTNYVAK
ncbi:MAG: hypothetical protein IBX55_01535 [Methyloprofundus sp.]|nr:hypothetical protein [Methyloprofundus sp.]